MRHLAADGSLRARRVPVRFRLQPFEAVFRRVRVALAGLPPMAPMSVLEVVECVAHEALEALVTAVVVGVEGG
jgi:hypothetical protein